MFTMFSGITFNTTFGSNALSYIVFIVLRVAPLNVIILDIYMPVHVAPMSVIILDLYMPVENTVQVMDYLVHPS